MMLVKSHSNFGRFYAVVSTAIPLYRVKLLSYVTNTTLNILNKLQLHNFDLRDKDSLRNSKKKWPWTAVGQLIDVYLLCDSSGGGLLGAMYACVLALLGTALPLREALTKKWLTDYIHAVRRF